MQQPKIFSILESKFQSLVSRRPSGKQLGLLFGGLVLFIILLNGAMAWYYQNHYYANTKVGAIKVGGMSESRAYQVLADRIDRQPLVITIDDKELKIPTKELGVRYAIDETIARLNSLPKPVIPMMAWLPGNTSSSTTLQYQVDQAVFDAKLDSLLQEHTSEPQDAKLEINSGNAKIVAHKPGVQFNKKSVVSEIKTGLGQLSDKAVEVPIKEVAVKIDSGDLRTALDRANQQLRTKIKLIFEDNEFTPSRSEIGSWLQVNDKLEVAVVESAVSGYIEQIAEETDIVTKNEVITTLDGVETGRQAGTSGRSLNRADTTKAIMQALDKGENIEYQLQVNTVEPTTEYVRKYSFSNLTYSYCVQANSVSEAMLDHFAQKIYSTLADSRGWGMDGRIQFGRVPSGCNFNLVLAAASTLPGYSSGCSIYWSCRVGSNVIINVDRWVGASDSWNQAGGSLDEYQSMVINHEVGHWLGFDHWTCGGPGQAAPVMLQQSIDLQGCTFNVWPTAAELHSLRQLKGI